MAHEHTEFGHSRLLRENERDIARDVLNSVIHVKRLRLDSENVWNVLLLCQMEVAARPQ